MYLFLGVLKHIDVLGDALCITIVGEHLKGEFDNTNRVDTAATQLEMSHKRLGGGIDVDGLGMLKIADPCVFGSIDDEGVIATFGGFVTAICGQSWYSNGKQKWHHQG